MSRMPNLLTCVLSAAVLTAAGAAHGAPAPQALELTVEVDAQGARVLSARPVASLPDPVRKGVETLQLLGHDGASLGSASLPDPRIRSSIPMPGTEDVAHSSVSLASGIVVVRVPWTGVAVAEARFRGRDVVVPPLSAMGSQGRSSTSLPRPPPGDAVLLQDSGPSSDRLDLVFLGDGYTEDQLGDYARDVDRMTGYLLSIEPYGAYSDLFNVWRVDVVSNDSGASHFETGRNDAADTALGCYYGCGGIDRLTCCDDSTVMSLVGDTVPGADGIMVLINDDTYGGSGGFNYATSYVGFDFGTQVAAHELGHSLIGLWDEYGYGGTGSGDGPNCTSDPDGNWDSWKGVNGIDAYPECSWSNLYRPTDDNCMMRTLSDDYCSVCRQEAVREIYRRMPGLVASLNPPPDPKLVVDAGGTRTGDVTIEVTTHAPERSLDFEWRLGGDVVGDDPTFDVSCAGLEGELTLTVQDPTPWVRDDPEGLLNQDVGPWRIRSGRCEDTVVDKTAEALGCQAAPAPASLGALLGLLALLRRRAHRS